MMENEYARAREVADWKKKVHRAWPQVRMRRLDTPNQEIATGNAVPIRVAVHLNGLAPDDVLMRCLVGTEAENGDFVVHDSYVFTPETVNDKDETIFKLDLHPRLPGLQYYKIRLYPFHPTLPHQFEMGYMLWL
jgi:starch phosphorylase